MNEEIILDKLRKMLFTTQQANECGLSNNDFKEDIQILSGAIGLIEKLKKANNKVLYDATTGNLTSIKSLDNNFIKKSKILDFINNYLPDDEICECCSNYDVNGVYLKNELKKLLKGE
jgi:hypothetical protein